MQNNLVISSIFIAIYVDFMNISLKQFYFILFQTLNFAL